MDTTRDYAYKLGCGRLIFEHGALNKLGAEVLRLGKCALIIGGEKSTQHVGAKIKAQLSRCEIRYDYDIDTGPCSEEKAQQIAARLQAGSYDVLLGVGGGRIMDLVKIAGDLACVPVITVPTISATCAAYTPLSVVYTEDGQCRGTWYFRREVDLVLCDLDVLCAQDPRYLAAGLLDAMAKHIEILHHQKTLASDSQDVLLAQLLAKTIYQDLMTLGQHLPAFASQQALERCIFHAIITTGLVSGVARGQYQSAMGHAFYEAVRTRYPLESKPFLHGEVVAIGLLLQEYYLGHRAEAEQLRTFMKHAAMPLTLADIHLPEDQAATDALAMQHPLPDFFLHGAEDLPRVQQLIFEQLTSEREHHESHRSERTENASRAFYSQK